MILGIGIDVIEVSRVTASFQRFGDRFLTRILRPNEIAYCTSHSQPGPFLAARFAAKEAVSKAFGTGIGSELGWQDIEVVRLPSGQPIVELHGSGRELLARRGGQTLHLTLTHTALYAAAVAILEGTPIDLKQL
ncbi:MAG: holo-[acyl-carrier-protein] synthase [Pedosphaera sp.]|nr:holo-[acyl-carrier-protein] synthase [Pedosphaera sp.]